LEVYGDGFPEDYIADFGFAGIRGIDYEPYEVVFDQAPPHTPQTTGGLPPGIDELQIDYSDCPMTQELFEHLMKEEGLESTGRLGIEPISEAATNPGRTEAILDLEEIVLGAAPLGESAQQVFLPRGSVAEGSQYDHFDQLPASDLTTAPEHYAAIDPQDFFEQQRRILDNGFGSLEVMPLDRGTPMEEVFLDQIVLSDPSQQMPLHMGPCFGPDMPPAP
jgi:hypothetical protein